jgi:hypothetical protein
MTKKEKNKLGEVHEVKDVKIAVEHNQEENTLTTHEKNHYKRGYMAHIKQNKKLGRCSKCGADKPCQPIKKKDFDKMLKAMLKVPPPKNWK